MLASNAINLDISISGLIAAIIFSAIGLYYFREGRRISYYPLLITALALMIYPYFTTGPMFDWGIGFALWGAAWWLKKRALA
jgi:hypothetical protein